MTAARSKAQVAADAVKVRAYIAALPPAARRHVKALRAAIRVAAPGVEDGWSYSIPAFRLDGRWLLGYAAWKAHVSMYPFGPELLRQLGVDPRRYKTSKGTIQFPLDAPLPVTLVKRLVKAKLVAWKAKAP